MSVAAAELAKAIKIRGVDLTVHSVREDLVHQDQESWGDVPLVTEATVGPIAYGLQPGLVQVLKRKQYDLLHLHGLWTYMSYAALKVIGKTQPLVVSPHGMLDAWALANSAKRKRFIGSLYEKRMLGTAACLHALCAQEANAICAYGYHGPIAVVPNGIELPKLFAKRAKPSWRDRLPDEAKVLLFLGRVHPKKGLTALIEAFGSLSGQETTVNPWHLVIMRLGSGRTSSDIGGPSSQIRTC